MRARVVNSLLVAFVGLYFSGAMFSEASAAPVAFRKCPTCSSRGAFTIDIHSSGLLASLPVGALVLSSSDLHGISAFSEIIWDPRGAKKVRILSTDLDMIELDASLYSRAGKVAPIEVPPDVATSATGQEEFIEGYVLTQLLFTGTSGWSIWHAILHGLGSMVYMEFADRRDGQVYRIWTKDKITLTFSDGSTAQVELIGPGAPSALLFQLDHDSIRDANGNPIAGFPPSSGSGSGTMALNPPTSWGQGRFLRISFQGSSCTGLIEVCSLGDCFLRRQLLAC